jgi:hypothetical protein
MVIFFKFSQLSQLLLLGDFFYDPEQLLLVACRLALNLIHLFLLLGNSIVKMTQPFLERHDFSVALVKVLH